LPARARLSRRRSVTSVRRSSCTSRTLPCRTWRSRRSSRRSTSLREPTPPGRLGTGHGTSTTCRWLRADQPAGKPRQTPEHGGPDGHRSDASRTRSRHPAVDSSSSGALRRRVHGSSLTNAADTTAGHNAVADLSRDSGRRFECEVELTHLRMEKAFEGSVSLDHGEGEVRSIFDGRGRQHEAEAEPLSRSSRSSTSGSAFTSPTPTSCCLTSLRKPGPQTKRSPPRLSRTISRTSASPSTAPS